MIFKPSLKKIWTFWNIFHKIFGSWGGTATLRGRIHGAVHMRNCGIDKSIRKRCSAVGAGVDRNKLVTTQLKQIRKRNKYQAQRKSNWNTKNDKVRCVVSDITCKNKPRQAVQRLTKKTFLIQRWGLCRMIMDICLQRKLKHFKWDLENLSL